MLLDRLRWTAYFALCSRGQARYPFRPIGSIARDRDARVRRMIRYAWRHVPYYRETMRRLELTPSDITTADELRKLPILEREQLQKDPEYFLAQAERKREFVELSSSGSTGAPVTVWHNLAAVFANAACGERERSIVTRLLDRPVGYRMAVLATHDGAVYRIAELCRTRRWLPPGVPIRRRFFSIFDAPAENAQRIREYRPELVHGFGSYIEALFTYVRESGCPFVSPKAVTYTADGMSPASRRLLAEEYGIPAFSIYQASEAFKIGFECDRHYGHHLNVDLYPSYVVGSSGAPAPPGAEGDVVVSNLVNRASVILNYRLGDVATLLPDPCPCGRSLPLLSFVEGRTDDWVTLPSGQRMHPHAFHAVLRAEKGVWRYQIVQSGKGAFRLDLVVSQAVNRDSLERRVGRALGERLGSDVSIEVRYVDALHRTEAGKTRWVLADRKHTPG